MLGFVAAIALSSAAAQAQEPLGPKNNYITVTASPGLVNFALKPSGISPGSAPVSITTTWQIENGAPQVTLYAYFSNPAAALSSVSGGQIPSSKVSGQVGAGPFSPFTGVGPFSAGSSLAIFKQKVKGDKKVTRTDTLDLQIDTAGLNLSPGTYTGVLRIQAQAL